MPTRLVSYTSPRCPSGFLSHVSTRLTVNATAAAALNPQLMECITTWLREVQVETIDG